MLRDIILYYLVSNYSSVNVCIHGCMFALHFYIDLINIHRISNGNQEYNLRGKFRRGKAGRRGMAEGRGYRGGHLLT